MIDPRYDKDELLSCIISLQTMCENLSYHDQEKGDNLSSLYHRYMAQTFQYIHEILQHRLP